MRLVFAGTPEVAVPSLQRLIDSTHEVIAVLTRPDARSGRGKKISRSPVALLADSADIPVLQPTKLRDEGFLEELIDLAPDACPVVAYGGLIPPAALAIPPSGWVNLHFSLLPAWRGAAPVQHSIWHGDDVTGASTFLLEEGLDTGPILGRLVEKLGPRDTAGDVLDRLAISGAELLAATIDGLAADRLVPETQSSEGVSFAPKLTTEDARIDWTQPAQAIERQVRACNPAPGAWSTFRGDRVKIFACTTADPDTTGEPGQLLKLGRNRWGVSTGTQVLVLDEVQAAGKKRMQAADWLRGLPPVGDESLQ